MSVGDKTPAAGLLRSTNRMRKEIAEPDNVCVEHRIIEVDDGWYLEWQPCWQHCAAWLATNSALALSGSAECLWQSGKVYTWRAAHTSKCWLQVAELLVGTTMSSFSVLHCVSTCREMRSLVLINFSEIRGTSCFIASTISMFHRLSRSWLVPHPMSEGDAPKCIECIQPQTHYWVPLSFLIQPSVGWSFVHPLLMILTLFCGKWIALCNQYSLYTGTHHSIVSSSKKICACIHLYFHSGTFYLNNSTLKSDASSLFITTKLPAHMFSFPKTLWPWEEWQLPESAVFAEIWNVFFSLFSLHPSTLTSCLNVL